MSTANVVALINSIGDSPLYTLQCHSAGYAGDPGFDYSGDFECRLTSIGGRETYSTLLTEDNNQSRDWESRGRFFAADLRGACARVSQFGAARSFDLRRMRVTEPVFTRSGKLQSLNLTVKVDRNPNARGSIAKTVPLPKTGVPRECNLKEYFVDPAPF